METNFTVSLLHSAENYLDKTMKIVSDDVLYYFKTSISITLIFLVATLGVVANMFNIIVFYKQGFRESVNITFMALSVWDLMICFLSAVNAVCFAIEVYFPIPYVSIQSIRYVYIAYSRGLANFLSTIVTVYLSVERSLCVTFPLKIKDIFTKRRVILVNTAFVIFGVASNCPAWATQRTEWVLSPRDNRTRLVLWLSANRRDIDLYIGSFIGMSLPMVSQVVITISSGVLGHSINKSSKFRKKAAHLGKSGATNNSKNESMSKVHGSNIHKSNTMTKKDLKLTKVVVLLTIIFFVCSLPQIMNIFVRVLIPEVDVGKKQQNLYDLNYTLVYLSISVKSTVNMCMYYYASSRYRKEFLSLFG